MRTQDIVIGETYRLRRTPDYGYVKAIQLFRANDTGNEFKCTVVKCEHTVFMAE